MDQGVRPLSALQDPPAALLHTPKMAPVIPGPDLAPDPGQNPGKIHICVLSVQILFPILIRFISVFCGHIMVTCEMWT